MVCSTQDKEYTPSIESPNPVGWEEDGTGDYFKK